jgi:hypothetical protein
MTDPRTCKALVTFTTNPRETQMRISRNLYKGRASSRCPIARIH